MYNDAQLIHAKFTCTKYDLKHDPNLESIRDEPEFQAVVKEIEADMAEQLAQGEVLLSINLMCQIATP